MADSKIGDFYAGRSVFVTGATGFVGKILIEKLLRSCPDIRTVFLLIRTKRGIDKNHRLTDLINSPVFEALKIIDPKILDKLEVIGGDISMPGLGISESDLQLLRSKVSIVFHSAARIKFDRDLREAIEINVRGGQRVLELCRQLPHLKALVHVSTCYVHPDKPELEEVVYPAAMDPHWLLANVDKMSESQLQDVTQKLCEMTKCPLVYGGTKAMTEQLLVEQRGSLPLVIVRPSIVTASMKEPVAGWVDNINGPTGLVAGAGKGFLRAFRYDCNAISDVIPVEFPVNLIIAAAWHKATYKTSNVEVYNCATGHRNPITWGRFADLVLENLIRYPVHDAVWFPSSCCRKGYWAHQIEKGLYHFVPAYLIDMVARLSGKKPQMVSSYQKAHKLMSRIDNYSGREWRFKTDNIYQLMDTMSVKDRRIFDLDVRGIDWPSYLRTYVLGTRQFIHKQDLNTLPTARKQLKQLYAIRMLTYLVLFFLLAFLLFGFAFKQSSKPLLAISTHEPIENLYSHLTDVKYI